MTGYPWLIPLCSRPGAPVRVYCLPYAGAGAGSYRHWPSELPDWFEPVAVRLPGRESRLRERPHERMDDLIAALTSQVYADVGKVRRYAVFGHSLGALTAFELVRALRDRGAAPPAHLFVSGRCAPHVPDTVTRIAHLPDAEFLAAVRAFGGMPAEVFATPDLVELLMPALRADFRVAESYRYRPGPPLDVPLTVLGSWEDPTTTPSQLAAWSAQTSRPFHLEMFHGDHFFVHAHRSEVLAELTRHLKGPSAAKSVS